MDAHTQAPRERDPNTEAQKAFTARAKAAHERLLLEHKDKQPDMVKLTIESYEEMLDPQRNIYFQYYMEPPWRISVEKAIELYKSGVLDGSKVTYICNGKVIEADGISQLPRYTIVDGLRHVQMAQRTNFGPR